MPLERRLREDLRIVDRFSPHLPCDALRPGIAGAASERLCEACSNRLDGPTKGKYRVEFYVPSATKRRIPDDDNPGKFIEEAPETLPRRYNYDSAITADYDPDHPQPLNYQLTTP